MPLGAPIQPLRVQRGDHHRHLRQGLRRGSRRHAAVLGLRNSVPQRLEITQADGPVRAGLGGMQNRRRPTAKRPRHSNEDVRARSSQAHGHSVRGADARQHALLQTILPLLRIQRARRRRCRGEGGRLLLRCHWQL